MILSQEQIKLLKQELVFTTARSGGPGGQHVNKVNTKVEVRFNISKSTILTDNQKEILIIKLESQLTNDGDFIVISQSSRSQLKNKQEATQRLIEKLERLLKPKKKRVPTKPTLVSKLKRLESKKRNSELKQSRRKPY